MGMIWEFIDPFLPGRGDLPLPVLLPVGLLYLWAACEIEVNGLTPEGICTCSYPRAGLSTDAPCPECGRTEHGPTAPLFRIRIRPQAPASAGIACAILLLHLALIRVALALNYHIDHFSLTTALHAMSNRELQWWPAITVAPQVWIAMLGYPVLIRFLPQRIARRLMYILAAATAILPLIRLADPANAM